MRNTTPHNNDPLTNALDEVGSDLRTQTPADLHTRITSAVRAELDRAAPAPLAFDSRPAHRSRTRWAAGLAAAAALIATTAVVLTQPSLTVPSSPSDTQADLNDDAALLAQAADAQDLGDWLASMNVSDDAFDTILTDADEQFWSTEGVLQPDASLF